MTDRHTGTNRERKLAVRYVEHAIILDIRPLSNANVVDISSHHTVEPHATFSSYGHIANDSCPVRQEHRIVNLRPDAPI